MTRNRPLSELGSPPFALRIYRTVLTLGKPIIKLILTRRMSRGKEDRARLSERFGVASIDRPAGDLIWIHAASVGEALSVMPLLGALLKSQPKANVLMTTGTVTSAKLIAEKLPPRAVHQFVPVDEPGAVKQFLDHWRPNVALWVESELWPNLIWQTAERRIKMALVNARLSPASFRGWRRAPHLIRTLLQCFDVCLAQDHDSARRFEKLGANKVIVTGNLKLFAPPLSFDEKAFESLEQALDERPCWLAASTHAGEETIIAACHKELKDRWPNLVTIIVPRHPERGSAIVESLKEDGLSIACRTNSKSIAPELDIYVADTLGELGLFYRLAKLAFIGGSLVRHGGQNPLEAARLGLPVLHGPHIFNFTPIYRLMDRGKASVTVADGTALSKAVDNLLKDEGKRRDMAARAKNVVAGTDAVLHNTLTAVADLMAHGPDIVDGSTDRAGNAVS